MEAEVVLKAENISKTFGSLNVLRDVNLSVKRGSITSIVGPSGAGKTTLLQILGTLDNPDTGNIIIRRQAINTLSGKRLANFRNKHIGFVFQFHHLLPEFTALENVMLPALIGDNTRAEATRKAHALLDYLGLSNREDHKPSQLSGGEQQRVAVARALVNDPAVVLADEPSGNLDTANAAQLHELFHRLSRERQQTFVIVTHNTDLATMSDYTVTMRDGKIIE